MVEQLLVLALIGTLYWKLELKKQMHLPPFQMVITQIF
jgi:hypothetical protein